MAASLAAHAAHGAATSAWSDESLNILKAVCLMSGGASRRGAPALSPARSGAHSPPPPSLPRARSTRARSLHAHRADSDDARDLRGALDAQLPHRAVRVDVPEPLGEPLVRRHPRRRAARRAPRRGHHRAVVVPEHVPAALGARQGGGQPRLAAAHRRDPRRHLRAPARRAAAARRELVLHAAHCFSRRRDGRGARREPARDGRASRCARERSRARAHETRSLQFPRPSLPHSSLSARCSATRTRPRCRRCSA